MALEPIGGGVDYVASTAPSSPKDKEVWVDVSVSPPLVKVYDADNTSWKSATNVVSDGTRFTGSTINEIKSNNDPTTTDYGATATDKNTDTEIRDGVWSDSTKAAGSDIAGIVDWASLTPQKASASSGSTNTISGEGYLLNVYPGEGASNDTQTFSVDIDGTTLESGNTFQASNGGSVNGYTAHSVTWMHHFSSSLTVGETSGSGTGVNFNYVLV